MKILNEKGFKGSRAASIALCILILLTLTSVLFLSIGAGCIISLQPDIGCAGDKIKIIGTGFGTSVEKVTFNGVEATDFILKENGSIEVTVPKGATTGSVYVTSGGQLSNPKTFTISTSGRKRWGANGVAVSAVENEQMYPQIAPCAFGGAFVAWKDKRGTDYDIYVQWVLEDGTNYYKPNGIYICTVTEMQCLPRLISDGAGGAIIIWMDYRSNAREIWAQRIDYNGTPRWGVDQKGLKIGSTNVGSGWQPAYIISDGIAGGNGAIIAWVDGRSGNDDIYAQKVTQIGGRPWGTEGRLVCGNPGNQNEIELTTDGANGAIVTWTDWSTNSGDICAAKVNSTDGSVAWSKTICGATRKQSKPKITSDKNNGAIIAWWDQRNSSLAYHGDVYAYRVNSSGNAVWSPAETLVCGGQTACQDPEHTSDLDIDTGGTVSTISTVITWTDWRGAGGFVEDLYAQKVSPTGSILWGSNGKLVCNAVSDQINPVIVSDDSGGAVISWEDRRSGLYAIYSQRVDLNGNGKWGSNGLRLCDTNKVQQSPQIASNGWGGAYITWMMDTELTWDVYAQKATD